LTVCKYNHCPFGPGRYKLINHVVMLPLASVWTPKGLFQELGSLLDQVVTPSVKVHDQVTPLGKPPQLGAPVVAQLPPALGPRGCERVSVPVIGQDVPTLQVKPPLKFASDCPV
jgi:hypothetical protein